MTIAIILGSTRPGRIGAGVAQWVFEHAGGRAHDYELVDLADFDLDLLNEPTVPGAAKKQYENPRTQAWSDKIDGFDGYVFVTPEYNHGVPAALKNAFDVLGSEWRQKAIGFVSYGADGGIRAVEHWRVITLNFSMLVARNQVPLSTFYDFEDGTFAPEDRRPEELTKMLDELEPLVEAGRRLRG